MSKTNPDFKMSKGRLWLANAVIVLFLAGSLFEIVTGQEHWPFSSYQMYARVRKEARVTRPRLFGVTAEKPSREIPLYEFRYIQPFDKSRLARAFTKMKDLPNRDVLFNEAVRDCFRRYEKLRREGRHSGPVLQALRLYEVSWELDPWARNVEEPDQKILLAEVRKNEIAR